MPAKAIGIRLSEAMIREIDRIAEEEHIDRSVIIRRLVDEGLKEWKLEKALKDHQKGKVTLWRAAEIADRSLREMMRITRERGIMLQYSLEELEEDIRWAFKKGE